MSKKLDKASLRSWDKLLKAGLSLEGLLQEAWRAFSKTLREASPKIKAKLLQEA